MTDPTVHVVLSELQRLAKAAADSAAALAAAVGNVDGDVAAVGAGINEVAGAVGGVQYTADAIKTAVDAMRAAGSGIKSVQRGKTSTSSSTNVTIAPVNPAKTMLNLLTAGSYNVPSQTSTLQAMLELISATELRVTGFKSGNTTTSIDVSWEVIEFY